MKKIGCILLIIYISFMIFAEELPDLPVVGITYPYMANDNTLTEFFARQFVFEFMSNSGLSCWFEMLYTDYDDEADFSESEYLSRCMSAANEQNFDYVLFFKVYTLTSSLYQAKGNTKTNLIFKYSLINASNGKTQKSGIYNLADSYSLNEQLSYISKKIFYDLSTFRFETSKDKKNASSAKTKQKKQKPDKDDYDIPEEIEKNRKHEIYVLNGFLKPSVRMLGFVSVAVGYSFIPYKFFDFGGAVFFGGGGIEDKVSFDHFALDKFYFGTNTGLNFFLPGFAVEPSVGVKLELSYIVGDLLDLYIPIELGLKINLRRGNYLKMCFDMQFTTFNVFENEWQNNYLLGIWVGYAKKI